MGINNIVRSKGYKQFMAKLYGIGASVVILGALFKINHYAGANYMLIAGLGTEACIFFFSAWEPLHVEYDWSLVYPELGGMLEEDYKKGKQKKTTVTQELDKMLADAKIGPELIDSLGQGLRTLSETASSLVTVTDAAKVSEVYASTLKTSAEKLASLNAIYEMQLQSANAHMETTAKVQTNMELFVNQLQESYENTVKYKEEVDSINKKVTQLNNVYGNMLSAMGMGNK
ncbi:MAG: gliding motility protein GldL [Bacteroidetes bacterium]|nr:gliding motility protein GldL [Bacteroidota bacterium]